MEFLSAALLFYLALLAFLYFYQRSLMYFPDQTRPNPAGQGLATLEAARVTTGDGLALEGWYIPPQQDKEVLLYFHGNASHYGARISKAMPYVEKGYGVLLAGYRGYGGNSGTPSEQGFYNDGRAWIGFLKNRNIDSQRIILYGESIGSGTAVQMANEYDIAALILESPFSSAVDIARRPYFFLPLKLMMKDQYLNIDKIGAVRAPVMIIHGALDTIIPLSSGQKLFEAAPEPKSFITIEKAGHNDLYDHGAALYILQFIDKVEKPTRP